MSLTLDNVLKAEFWLESPLASPVYPIVRIADPHRETERQMRHLKRATKSIVMFVYQRLRLEKGGGVRRTGVLFVSSRCT
jgi:hypothetical protein